MAFKVRLLTQCGASRELWATTLPGTVVVALGTAAADVDDLDLLALHAGPVVRVFDLRGRGEYYERGTYRQPGAKSSTKRPWFKSKFDPPWDGAQPADRHLMVSRTLCGCMRQDESGRMTAQTVIEHHVRAREVPAHVLSGDGEDFSDAVELPGVESQTTRRFTLRHTKIVKRPDTFSGTDEEMIVQCMFYEEEAW